MNNSPDLQNPNCVPAQRLDKLLVEKGLVISRPRAKVLIESGEVLVDGIKIISAGKKVSPNSEIKITGEDIKWVSRGGLKLEKALDKFKINVADKICLDVGASTGGFTDVLLANGAKKVYAIDVGHSQLAEKLKNDGRVVNIEKVNARQISPEILPEKIDFCCIDVSFISLELILPEVIKFLAETSAVVALIKPQFEVGKENLGKSGVVRDPNLHRMAIEKIKIVIKKINLKEFGVIPSPIKGGDGNKEFLIYLKVSAKQQP